MSLDDRKGLGGARLGEETKLSGMHWARNDHHVDSTLSATGMPMGLIARNREWAILKVYAVTSGKMTQYQPNQRIGYAAEEGML